MVFHIADDHFAETFRIFVLRSAQKNNFIAQDGSGILLDIVFRDVVGRIGLEARDKIHTGEIPFIQHGKIDVSAITNHHAVTREFHSSGAVYLMNISIGEINEHGKMTIVIQQHIELDCPFGLPIGVIQRTNAKNNRGQFRSFHFFRKPQRTGPFPGPPEIFPATATPQQNRFPPPFSLFQPVKTDRNVSGIPRWRRGTRDTRRMERRAISAGEPARQRFLIQRKKTDSDLKKILFMLVLFRSIYTNHA